jgi:hypothetical protein
MDIQDFVPTGGGSLRDPYGTREPLGTFTDTRTPHPDEYWHPLGGELSSRAPSLSAADDQGEARQQSDARPGRPGTGTSDGFDLQGTARTIRSALRPGG